MIGSVQSVLDIVKILSYFHPLSWNNWNIKFLMVAVHSSCNLCGDLNRLTDRFLGWNDCVQIILYILYWKVIHYLPKTVYFCLIKEHFSKMPVMELLPGSVTSCCLAQNCVAVTESCSQIPAPQSFNMTVLEAQSNRHVRATAVGPLTTAGGSAWLQPYAQLTIWYYAYTLFRVTARSNIFIQSLSPCVFFLHVTWHWTLFIRCLYCFSFSSVSWPFIFDYRYVSWRLYCLLHSSWYIF